MHCFLITCISTNVLNSLPLCGSWGSLALNQFVEEREMSLFWQINIFNAFLGRGQTGHMQCWFYIIVGKGGRRGANLQEIDSLYLLGLPFSAAMMRKDYTESIASSADKKIDSLRRARQFSSPESILQIYKSAIGPLVHNHSHGKRFIPSFLLRIELLVLLKTYPYISFPVTPCVFTSFLGVKW